jgi:hypothetical protein
LLLVVAGVAIPVATGMMVGVVVQVGFLLQLVIL